MKLRPSRLATCGCLAAGLVLPAVAGADPPGGVFGPVAGSPVVMPAGGLPQYMAFNATGDSVLFANPGETSPGLASVTLGTDAWGTVTAAAGPTSGVFAVGDYPWSVAASPVGDLVAEGVEVVNGGGVPTGSISIYADDPSTGLTLQTSVTTDGEPAWIAWDPAGDELVATTADQLYAWRVDPSSGSLTDEQQTGFTAPGFTAGNGFASGVAASDDEVAVGLSMTATGNAGGEPTEGDIATFPLTGGQLGPESITPAGGSVPALVYRPNPDGADVFLAATIGAGDAEALTQYASDEPGPLAAQATTPLPGVGLAVSTDSRGDLAAVDMLSNTDDGDASIHLYSLAPDGAAADVPGSPFENDTEGITNAVLDPAGELLATDGENPTTDVREVDLYTVGPLPGTATTTATDPDPDPGPVGPAPSATPSPPATVTAPVSTTPAPPSTVSSAAPVRQVGIGKGPGGAKVLTYRVRQTGTFQIVGRLTIDGHTHVYRSQMLVRAGTEVSVGRVLDAWAHRIANGEHRQGRLALIVTYQAGSISRQVTRRTETVS
jgi:hypothetical protein